MSLDHNFNPSPNPLPKLDPQTHQPSTKDGRKTTPSLTNMTPDHPNSLKCPRCDSPNTKFCYYNNYSLTQPRHFCKNCRRYWTKGGALRNVPVGGGCRKNKKMIKSSSLSNSSTPENLSGFKFFNGFSPAVDFTPSLIPRLGHNPLSTGLFYNQLSPHHQLGISSSSITTNPHNNDSLMGFNYPIRTANGGSGFGMSASLNVDCNLASSIESLSSMNQDLHWKLQQQRLSMLFSGGDSTTSTSISTTKKDNYHGVSSSVVGIENDTQKLQPILFRELENSKSEEVRGGHVGSNIGRMELGRSTGDHDRIETEWFFGQSYAGGPVSTTAQIDTNSENGGNGMSGIHVLNDLHPYSHAFP